jgi:hypothetical protein
MNRGSQTMLRARLPDAEKESSLMIEWEYEVTLVRNTTVPEPIAEALNEAGQQGWELVAAIPTSGGLSGPALLTILKRPALATATVHG